MYSSPGTHSCRMTTRHGRTRPCRCRCPASWCTGKSVVNAGTTLTYNLLRESTSHFVLLWTKCHGVPKTVGTTSPRTKRLASTATLGLRQEQHLHAMDVLAPTVMTSLSGSPWVLEERYFRARKRFGADSDCLGARRTNTRTTHRTAGAFDANSDDLAVCELVGFRERYFGAGRDDLTVRELMAQASKVCAVTAR